MASWLAYVND